MFTIIFWNVNYSFNLNCTKQILPVVLGSNGPIDDFDHKVFSRGFFFNSIMKHQNESFYRIHITIIRYHCVIFSIPLCTGGIPLYLHYDRNGVLNASVFRCVRAAPVGGEVQVLLVLTVAHRKRVSSVWSIVYTPCFY